MSQNIRKTINEPQKVPVIREIEQGFRTLLETVPDSMVVVDSGGEIILVNTQAVTMFGYARDELLGKTIELLVPERFREEHSEHRSHYFAAPAVRRMGSGLELSGLRKDGTEFPVEISLAPLKTTDGLLACAAIRDISERIQFAEREALIKELEERNAELEQFAYTVSHDLKSPLVTIQGFVGTLKKSALEGNVSRLEEDTERIRKAADQMKQLLDALLELSRIGRIANPPEDVQMGDLAREVVDLCSGALAETGVRVEISRDLPTVRGDRVRLREVLQNLVENAIQFTAKEAKPRIEIGVCQVGQGPVIFVRDNGVGIDVRYQARIFKLFEKLDKRTAGSGIGLALIKRIVEVHDGRIWVESEGVGKGATFYFTLGESPEK